MLQDEGKHATCVVESHICSYAQAPSDCQLRAHSLSAEGNLIVGNSYTEDCFSDKHCKNFVTSCFPVSPLLSSQFPILLQNFLLLLRKNSNGKIWICRMSMERTASSHSALWNLESHKMPVLPSAGSFGRAQQEGFCTLHPSSCIFMDLCWQNTENHSLLWETEQSTAQQDREEVDREMMGQLLPLCIAEMSMTES